MLLIYGSMLLYITECPLHKTLPPAILVGTVQLVWPSVSMIIISAHAHQDLKERTAVKL